MRTRRSRISRNHKMSAAIVKAGHNGRRSLWRSVGAADNADGSGFHDPPVADASDFNSASSVGRKRYSAASSGMMTREMDPPAGSLVVIVTGRNASARTFAS